MIAAVSLRFWRVPSRAAWRPWQRDASAGSTGMGCAVVIPKALIDEMLAANLACLALTVCFEATN